jgi:hypothetical protein
MEEGVQSQKYVLLWEYMKQNVLRLTEDWTLEGCETSEKEGWSYVYDT